MESRHKNGLNCIVNELPRERKAFQPGITRTQAEIDQFKDMTQVQKNDSYQIMIQMVSVGKHLK